MVTVFASLINFIKFLGTAVAFILGMNIRNDLPIIANRILPDEIDFAAEYRSPISNESDLQDNALLIYATWCVRASFALLEPVGARNRSVAESCDPALTSANGNATLSTPDTGFSTGVNS